MDLSLYIDGDSLLHRMKAAYKFLCLMILAIALYLTDDLQVLLPACLFAVVLIGYLRIPFYRLKQFLLYPMIFMVIFALFNGYFGGYLLGLATFFRLFALILFAIAVTSTTRSDDFMGMIERALLPLSFLPFINPKSVSLAVSLTLRFIPEIFKLGMDIREAQAARGLGRHPLATIIPLIVLTLKRADDISDAIDARKFD